MSLRTVGRDVFLPLPSSQGSDGESLWGWLPPVLRTGMGQTREKRLFPRLEAVGMPPSPARCSEMRAFPCDGLAALEALGSLRVRVAHPRALRGMGLSFFDTGTEEGRIRTSLEAFPQGNYPL